MELMHSFAPSSLVVDRTAPLPESELSLRYKYEQDLEKEYDKRLRLVEQRVSEYTCLPRNVG